MCVTMTWDTVCDNVTTMSTGILKNVTANFNPFCGGGKDPWASEEDLCKPYHEEITQSTQPVCKMSGAGRREYSITALWLSLWLCALALYVWE